MCINVDANGDGDGKGTMCLYSLNYYEVIVTINFTGLSSELLHMNY